MSSTASTSSLPPRAELATIVRYAAADRAMGVIADLSDSTNAWGPAPAAVRAARAVAESAASYPTAYGDELKAALAAYHGSPYSLLRFEGS